MPDQRNWFQRIFQLAPQKTIHNRAEPIVNALSDAILGFNPNQFGVQLSQTDSLYINNRWYLVSNQRQVLSQLYAEHGLIQTLVDVPVDDGLRGGIIIHSKQLGDDVEELQHIVEKENILTFAFGEALKWNRLYGGAGVLCITDQDPEEPFNIEAIGPDTPLEFRSADLWELFWDKQNLEQYEPEIQEYDAEFYSYYGKRVHKSRVRKMKGKQAPSFIRPRLRGWGLSVVEAVIRSFNQYLKENDLIYEVMDEFKLDIYKIQGFNSTLLDSGGADRIRNRVQLANQQKNYQKALTMDAEDDYMQKQLSFSGLAEIMKEIKMGIACDLRMPMTKLFGISAAGFNSGEDDIENYNAMIESEIRAKCKHDIMWMLEILCKKHFGFVPDDLKIEFKPLRMLSAEQEETVKNHKFARLIQAQQAGLIQVKEFKDGCNKDNLLPVQIDPEIDLLLPQAQDMEDAGDQTPESDGQDDSGEKPQAKEKPKPEKVEEQAKKPKSDKPAKPVMNSDLDAFHALTVDEKLKHDELGKDVIQNPGKVDEALWEKAKRAAKEAGADNIYAFASYWYQKQGGKFG